MLEELSANLRAAEQNAAELKGLSARICSSSSVSVVNRSRQAVVLHVSCVRNVSLQLQQLLMLLRRV